MKKLFFASVFALATLTACNNSEATKDDFATKIEAKSNKNVSRESRDFNPYEKDNKIHIAINSQGIPYAFFDGELMSLGGNDADEAIKEFEITQTTSRVLCMHNHDGITYGFVNVNGGNWMVVIVDGHSYAWQVPKPSLWDCAMVVLGYYDVQVPYGPGVY